jgi:hypothetical protein
MAGLCVFCMDFLSHVVTLRIEQSAGFAMLESACGFFCTAWQAPSDSYCIQL